MPAHLTVWNLRARTVAASRNKSATGQGQGGIAGSERRK
jgi:hypothetical protein